jgi:phospholipid transport system substrate-binding protein
LSHDGAPLQTPCGWHKTLQPEHWMSAMLNTRSFRLLPVLLLLLVGVCPALAQDRAAEIRTLLEQRDRQIKQLLGNRTTLTEGQKDQLKGMINDVIDFQAMGSAALGSFWNTLTPAQRTEFVAVFGDIVRTQSLADLEVYRATVRYEAINVQGNTARVVTQTTYNRTTTKVEYVMGFSQRWRVYDLILDGVSTVEGYARSFQSVIRNRGFEALMTSLRRKREQVASSS